MLAAGFSSDTATDCHFAICPPSRGEQIFARSGKPTWFAARMANFQKQHICEASGPSLIPQSVYRVQKAVRRSDRKCCGSEALQVKIATTCLDSVAFRCQTKKIK
eukprot:s1326_g2.t1